MKAKIFLAIFILSLGLVFPRFSFAQDMMGEDNTTVLESNGHTAREEAEGKEVWEKLQTEELKCENLSDDDFGSLGEYYMGQMMGKSHEAMNNRLIQMLGEKGEEQMHIAMGKRMSNCEPDAPLPQNMMGGGENPMMGSFSTNLMGTFGWGFGWIFMILFWGLIILGIVALVKWTVNQGKSQTQNKSALDILKERYAKGEIDKKDFEEKKKDLN